LAILYATKLILRCEGLRTALIALGSASFFVYAAHEPLLRIVRLLAFKYVPLHGVYTMLALYLVIPILVMALLVFCHRLLVVLCPRPLSLVTGGR
jgi:hypothetical protein